MSYDDWKLRAPEDDLDAPDDREFISCDWCDGWLEDGTGERIGGLYGHPRCAREQNAILAQGLMTALAADEQRDDTRKD